MPTTREHEAAQVRDAALFIGLPNPALWSGPPVREGDLAAWMESVEYFTTLEINSVLTVHSRSGNAFELYGKGRSFLNPVRLARYSPWAIEADSAEENPEVLVRAHAAWRYYVDGVVRRLGPPVRVTEDGDRFPEAIWLPGGEEGPRLRLWLNCSQVLNPDIQLSDKMPGAALVRLDAYAPAQPADAAPAEVSSANDVPEWIPASYQEYAVQQARLEYEAPEDDDDLVKRIQHALAGALRNGGSVRAYLGDLAESAVASQPDVDSYHWQHVFQHPDAPQGRLPALHMAHVISVLVNQTTDGSARIPETVEPGLSLHYYDLFNPRMQNSLGITGQEACAVWRRVNTSYRASIPGNSYMVAPTDVVERLSAQADKTP
ncbi:hypothetical protein ABZZ17_30455 [Streptomyces sp. NPDC006512]|uniref:hypothetical protein n=1 Tax=Streptomyces sp. NPDC006512 TaxID=3154307 RepID=UPI0033A8C0C4